MLPNPFTADLIARILGLHSITVVDVGARFGAETAWWRLHPLAKLVGFEPAMDECERLRSSVGEGRQEQYIPIGLGKMAGVSRLFRTVEPGCSSIYRSRADLIERYPILSCMKVVAEEEIEVTTLDAWADATGTTDIRFIKLDTQGSELDILQGAERVLADCVGVEVEVEFSPMYAGMPVFADVDRYLRAQGFCLWRVNDLCHYAETTSQAKTCYERAYYGGIDTLTAAGNGRLFWGNAVYFRDYAEFASSVEGVRRLLVLACLLGARGDLSGAVSCVRRVLDWHSPGLSGESVDDLRTAAGTLLQQIVGAT